MLTKTNVLKWLPTFRLVDGSVSAVMILLRPEDKDTAAPEKRPEPTSSVADHCPHARGESSAPDE